MGNIFCKECLEEKKDSVWSDPSFGFEGFEPVSNAETSWLSNVTDVVTDFVEDTVEFVQDGAEDLQDKFEEVTGIDYLQDSAAKLKETGKRCSKLAFETRDLCDEIKTHGEHMVRFGSEVHETLTNFSSEDNNNASIIEVIKDLTDGDRVREAMALAKDTDKIVISCIEKSMEMVDTMEATMVSLPDFIENPLRRFAEKYDANAEEEQEQIRDVMDVDGPIQDIKDCIVALQELNITTAFKVGKAAFEQLSKKVQLSLSIFASVQAFAINVGAALKELEDLDFGDVKHFKMLLVCVRRAAIMKKLSQGAKKLIEIVVDLFQATSDRISTLWEALAICKKCMNDCVQDIQEAKDLCLDARDKSIYLVQISRDIKDKLETVGEFNKKSFAAIRELTKERGEIREAINTARNMDDLVIECAGKVIRVITRVTEAFHNLPDIITDGFDVSTSGKQDDDPVPRDIEGDIFHMDTSRKEIENASIIQVVKSGSKGFSNVNSKIDICKQMLYQVDDFSANCMSVIGSFMGAWKLGSAIDKLQEMCRLVRLGELIKNFAEHIKRLIQAAITLMKSSLKRLSLNYDDFKEDLVDGVEDVLDDIIGDKLAEKVSDKVGDLADTLKFWD